MNTKIIFSLILVLGLGGVLAVYLTDKQNKKSDVIQAVYGCSENKTINAAFSDKNVALTLSDGRNIELPVAMSASGARYANSDETFVFWNKGDTAFIEEAGQMTYKDCIEVGKGTPTQSMTDTGMTKSYTLSDVATHGIEADCWMAIENKVYAVTEFVAKHPGGKAILNGCGKDATQLFNERPTNQKGPHPATARELLPTYLIGDLAK